MNTTTHTTIMNATRLALAALLTFSATAEEHEVPPPAPGFSSDWTAVLIDDETGEELFEAHGIEALDVADLDGVINAVIRGRKSVCLMHVAVDEWAEDNPVSSMEFRPYGGGVLPQPPPPTLPLRQLVAEMKRFKKERGTWQRGIMAYRQKIVSEVDGFVRQVTVNQLEVSQRFDRKLLERNGRDFNRSDIVGCIEKANGLLAGAAHPVLVLNSDCVDRPDKKKRQPRAKPLTEKQIDPRVTLIFVNTSRKPEQEILFKGLKNTVRHADSMSVAMDILAGILNEEEKPEKGDDIATATEPGM